MNVTPGQGSAHRPAARRPASRYRIAIRSRLADQLPLGRATDSFIPAAYPGVIHPPKHETFDLTARTNTDPKGVVRAVDVYTLQPWGLYMARPTPGRAQFHYMQAWLLPSLGLRATVFHFNPGHERDEDFYLDVGEYTPGQTVWRSEDHYLDLFVRTGMGVELADVDELLAAVRYGLLPPEIGEQAVHRAAEAIEGLSRNDYDLDRWLTENGTPVTWRSEQATRHHD